MLTQMPAYVLTLRYVDAFVQCSFCCLWPVCRTLKGRRPFCCILLCLSLTYVYRPDQAKAGISVQLPYTDLQSVSASWYFY